jgi:hypothetical protein
VAQISESARHGACKKESTNAYNVMVGKPERKRQLGSPTLGQDNIKIYFKGDGRLWTRFI